MANILDFMKKKEATDVGTGPVNEPVGVQEVQIQKPLSTTPEEVKNGKETEVKKEAPKGILRRGSVTAILNGRHWDVTFMEEPGQFISRLDYKQFRLAVKKALLLHESGRRKQAILDRVDKERKEKANA